MTPELTLLAERTDALLRQWSAFEAGKNKFSTRQRTDAWEALKKAKHALQTEHINPILQARQNTLFPQ